MPAPNKLKSILLRITWLITSPSLLLLLPQAIYVKRTTLRLPEAQLAQQPQPATSDVSVLHLGESTVAGVGVTTLDDGFTANLADNLSQQMGQQVEWQAHGVNGIRLKALIEQIKGIPFRESHAVIVTMGVNDTTGLTSIKLWRQQLIQLIDNLRLTHRRPIIFTQVPPMIKFPALPAPLRYIIGLRAALLNDVLQAVCHAQDHVYYLGIEPELEPGMMAEDGYHPSAQGYEAWAKAIGPEVKKILEQASS